MSQKHNPTRSTAEELDVVLGHKFPVLDHGFIRVVDYMGTDDSIVQAARISYGAGTKSAQDDRALIRYLLRNKHTTPFEMCDLKLHLRVPMDTWRQWIRHRTASVNEYSTRYSIAIEETQRTEPDAWRLQSSSNHQGSVGFIPSNTGANLSRTEHNLQNFARQVYEERLGAGVAREQARKDLPLSTYTEAYWKTNLHNLFHFLGLRLEDVAQAEIRAYARVIADEIVSRWCPVAWASFLDYRLNSLSLSSLELQVFRELVTGDLEEAVATAKFFDWIKPDGGLKSNRERSEFESKARRLGLTVPWLKDQSPTKSSA